MSDRTALLLIDFINTLDFDGAERLAPRAVDAARAAAALKHRAAAEGVPVIYVNDSFGDWGGNFSAVLARCEKSHLGAPLAKLLCPAGGEPSILKPRHSAFYGTPLEFVLDELAVDTLILAGLQTHICVLFSAHDAFLRRYDVWIPADCSASEHVRQHEFALAHAAEVTGACIEPFANVRVDKLTRVFTARGRHGRAASREKVADACADV